MNPHVVVLAAGLLSLSAVDAGEFRLAQADAAPTFESLDKNADGQVSLDEASAHDNLFTRFKDLDSNKDGVLTQREFANYSPGTSLLHGLTTLQARCARSGDHRGLGARSFCDYSAGRNPAIHERPTGPLC